MEREGRRWWKEKERERVVASKAVDGSGGEATAAGGL